MPGFFVVQVLGQTLLSGIPAQDLRIYGILMMMLSLQPVHLLAPTYRELRSVIESREEALASKGLIRLCYDELMSMGERDKAIQQGKKGNWCIDPIGALSFVKNLGAEGIVRESFASALAFEAEVSCPVIDVVEFAQTSSSSKITHACITPALGQKHQTLGALLAKKPDMGRVNMLSRDISFAFPFMALTNNRDYHDGNIIVAEWTDEQQNDKRGVYNIDLAGSIYYFPSPLAVTWNDWMKKRTGMREFFVDKACVALGVEAIAAIPEARIRQLVRNSFDYCGVKISDDILSADRVCKTRKELVALPQHDFGNVFGINSETYASISREGDKSMRPTRSIPVCPHNITGRAPK